MRSLFLAALLAAYAFPAPAAAPEDAKPRTARCALAVAADRPFKGPCLFFAEQNGSFTVQPAQAKMFFGGVASVSVWIVGAGRAEVRGLTADGVNSRWGEAKRSAKDRACWKGNDFSICVYR